MPCCLAQQERVCADERVVCRRCLQRHMGMSALCAQSSQLIMGQSTYDKLGQGGHAGRWEIDTLIIAPWILYTFD